MHKNSTANKRKIKAVTGSRD